MKRLIAIAAFLILLPGAAAAQEAYCVDDATDLIGAYRADLSTIPCKAGETGVELSTIQAATSETIYQGGTWKNGAYTLPVSQQEPTTTGGLMRKACRSTDRALLELAREIRSEWSRAYPGAVWKPAAGTVLQIRKGVRGVALTTDNADWTSALRLAFLNLSADGAGDWRKADDVLTPFFAAWKLGTPLTVPPGRRLVWINPATGAAITSMTDILAGADDANMVADATDQSVWRRAGGWCAEITG